MKKIIIFIFALCFISGCASFKKSEFLKHDTQYKNWDHMKFSIIGGNNPSDEVVKQSQEEGWWGEEVLQKK